MNINNFLIKKIRPSRVPFPPSTIHIIINTKCNAKCIMCDVGQDKVSQFTSIMQRGKDMDMATFSKIIDDSLSFKPHISLNSTEPLLHPRLLDFVKIVKDNGMICSLTTNGYLLPKFASKLCDLGLDSISISIDGLYDLNDRIRGVKGIFDRAVNGIEILNETEFSPNIKLSSTIMPTNAAYLSELAEYFKDKVSMHFFTHLNFVTLDMVKNTPISCTPSCMGENPKDMNIRVLSREILKLKKMSNVVLIPNISSVDDLRHYYYTDDFVSNHKCCNAIWRMMEVASNGDVVGSSRCYDMSFGNVKESSLLEIWNDKKMIDFRDYVKKNNLNACARCCGVF